MRVQPVPSDHPYVQTATAADEVHLLPDPPVPGAAAGVWWPPQVLGPTWTGDADVVHVHFGFEQVPLAQLLAWQVRRRDAGVGLVVTVHDLQNPHHERHEEHRAQLAVLLADADAVLTLTRGAATEIDELFGVDAQVIPHPHVVDLPRMAAPRPRRAGRPVVGVDLKALRANVDPGVVTGLVSDEWLLRVGVHADALARSPAVAAALDALEGPGVEVVRHARRSDAELYDHLEALDAVVLPYAWGTHSGWLETCWDLGTPVVVPDVGHLADQHGDATWARGDTTGLSAAVRTALGRPPVDRAARAADRQTEAAAVRAGHLAVYRSLTRVAA